VSALLALTDTAVQAVKDIVSASEQTSETGGLRLAAERVGAGNTLMRTTKAARNGGSVPRGADFVRAVTELAQRAGVDPSPLQRPRPRDRRADPEIRARFGVALAGQRQPAIPAAGLDDPLTPYSMRHTYASFALGRGRLNP
jgi:hypothetical protein